ncbi:hypothetical protein APJL_1608 [Actinobacillus pleuropneumoniae serovar 3 str. JL03]|uniref:Glycosyl transferase family 1 domain-containing protein n=1 Tax=Actinobacillus pleuropneumoniae serotype 3 (strain JL03) TaxID=434271 RepID=B0BRQ1_ACTPJ|nr:glycosyltransferase [Actinobacillus pleuropneumoniae]ABY70160.1 hypothetical protein APJL_1608 [Actinobacillus pleuropneumoniae serovar 3 str. JL03]UKH15083.1 glycosyltransferase [Actinobacillus pleuropneumoniae]UKH44262.1 glycosyltransferase [Actinobacillus pleuropneumoniae]
MAIIQLIDTLGLGRGGLTKAIYERVTYLSQIEKVTLVVTGLQFDVQRVASLLKEQKQIPEELEVVGLFDFAFGSEKLEISPPIALDKSNLYKTIEATDSSNIYRYFDEQGRFLGLENYSTDNTLNFLEVHSKEFPHICRARQIYDSNGHVRCVRYFDYTWKPRFETVFESSGNPIYSCWLTETGNRYRIISFGKENKIAKICSDFYQLRADILYKIIEQYPNSILISDEPTTIAFISRDFGFKKYIREGIGYIHTTHTYQSAGVDKLKPWFFDYKLNSGVLSLILSTNEIQAVELRKVIAGANEQNVKSLPHSIEIKTDTQIKKFPTGRLLFLGRLSDEKRVDLVIKGFSVALRKMPNLTLDIVGDGPLMSAHKQLVKDLNISKSVIFHGYSLDVNSWFKQADCHFLVSKFEGFGLVLIEGLSNACPCIVSPCKYGPDQVIENNINGIRVSATPEEIGKAIIKLYSNNTLATLSEGALKTSYKYSKLEWKQKWNDIISSTI